MAQKWKAVRGKFAPEVEAEISQRVKAESLQVTAGDARGVSCDLFPKEEAARLTEKARLLSAIMAQVRATGISKGGIGRHLWVGGNTREAGARKTQGMQHGRTTGVCKTAEPAGPGTE